MRAADELPAKRRNVGQVREVRAVRAVLRNRDLRRVLAGYGFSVVAEWAMWTGVLVFAYARGGAAATGATSLVLLLTAAVFAPAAGTAADGARPNRVLAVAYLTGAIALALSAVAARLGWSLGVVVAPAALAAASVTFVRPALSVVVPGLVTTTDQLTSANLLTGFCDSGCVLVGPLVAGLLLRWHGPAAALGACAALMVLSALATATLIALDPPSNEAVLLRDTGRLRTMRNGLRALDERPGATSLLALLGGQHLLVGALDLLVVLIASEQLHLSVGGPGFLGAVVGGGAAVGGLVSMLVVGRARLAPALLFPMAAAGLALVALGVLSGLVVAVIALAAVGLGRSVAEISGRMLLQRAAPQDALASVFASLEAVSLVSSALGSALAQVLVALANVRVATLGVGAVLVALVVANASQLRTIDRSADAPVVAIRLLRRIPLFAALPGPALEGVARAARHVRYSAGEQVITEGEAGHEYFAVVAGSVSVSVGDEAMRTMRRGDGFGEIALLADVPRTASVSAVDDVELMAIDRMRFLTAVTGHDASRQAAWSVARGWGPAPIMPGTDGDR